LTGTFVEDKIVNGEVLIRKTKIKYLGQLRNELFHGKGLFTNELIGLEYVGDFVDGVMEGKGKMKNEFESIIKYVGDFKNGKPNGEGHI